MSDTRCAFCNISHVRVQLGLNVSSVLSMSLWGHVDQSPFSSYRNVDLEGGFLRSKSPCHLFWIIIIACGDYSCSTRKSKFHYLSLSPLTSLHVITGLYCSHSLCYLPGPDYHFSLTNTNSHLSKIIILIPQLKLRVVAYITSLQKWEETRMTMLQMSLFWSS